MTTEAFIPADDYVVAGAGPYPIPHEYGESGALVAEVLTGITTLILTEGIDYSVTPEAEAASGNLYLTADAAVTHDGKTLRITRATIIEQGFASTGGARETGLEKQLDRLTRGIQDLERKAAYMQAAFQRTLRIPELLDSVSPLPALAYRANKLLAFDGQGNPTAAEATVAVIADGSWIIGTALTAYLVTVDPAVEVIETQGYAARGDGGHGTYRRVGADPGHAGRLQTAEGSWWELIDEEPLSRQVGAKWNLADDDTAAINAFHHMLRVTGKRGRHPAGHAFCSGTIYAGGVRVRGAGASPNSFWVGGGTWIHSNGQPIWSNAADVDSDTLFSLEETEDVGILWAGGTLNNDDPAHPDGTINLFDKPNYPFQIGFQLGRNLRFIPTKTELLAADPEKTPTISGDGVMSMRRCTAQSIGGWGWYLFAQFGNSRITDCYARRCGGPASVYYEALEPGLGNTRGGTINFASACVDVRVDDLHTVGGPDNEQSPWFPAEYAGTGTFIRIGSAKSEVDAQDYPWDSTNNITLGTVHSEGHAIGLDVRSAKFFSCEDLNSNKGTVNLGWASNPSGDTRVLMRKTRIVGADINVCQSPHIDLGTVINATPFEPISINYWTGTHVEGIAQGLGMDDVFNSAINLAPQTDITTAPGYSPGMSDHNRLPFIRTRLLPTSVLNNLFPAFAATAGGSLINGWVSTGDVESSIVGVQPFEVGLEEGRALTNSITGCVPGQLYTFMVRIRWTGSLALGGTPYALRDGSDNAIIERDLGAGSQIDGDVWRCMNFLAPDDTVKVNFYGGTKDVPAIFSCPILVKGALDPLGPDNLGVWPARGQMISTFV
ncbi:hypothetical protein SAMN05444336_101254 [Albimonas donghaensis]|uniref:Phage T7 tail fibre protein n=1 Tax=Albimonas donghaensis TaxID=356660 RepID=A0A1H2R6W7_9RHOB|nr:hypothetical protein [Albimonas donghaensis]SDW15111.1 hypothetical protein SAMN05444336_101254 [Albimonas donghaensis]